MITIVETSRRLGLSRQWIFKLCQQGRIPGACKIGCDWLIPAGAKIAPTGLGRPLRTTEILRGTRGKR